MNKNPLGDMKVFISERDRTDSRREYSEIFDEVR
jgi:hypothetical protein